MVFRLTAILNLLFMTLNRSFISYLTWFRSKYKKVKILFFNIFVCTIDFIDNYVYKIHVNLLKNNLFATKRRRGY